MKKAIDVINVTVDYHNQKALDDVTLSVPHGAICGLVGMNGAGKSTLFNTLMGFVKPALGSVSIDGLPLRDAQKKGLVAYVPQSEDVDWDFPVTVEEIVMMGRYGFMNRIRTSRPVDQEMVHKALERVQMTAFKDRQIGQLSGGQRKRVFFSRALAQEAQIMLLDEPFAGVDAKTEAEITKVLLELKEEGKTILISTHELTSLSEYCDHVILLKKKLVAYGTTEKVFTPENISHTFDGMLHRLTIGHKPVDINH